MKGKKRILPLLLCGILCLTIACAAFAEGKLLTIWNAGSKLLFDTDNVTLMGYAEFTYDDEVFKSFSGTYTQSGANSYMQAMFDTPKDDGTIYTGGYTVFANDGTAYAIDTAQPHFYRTNGTSRAHSILTNTVIRNSLMRFGGLLLDLMEDRMADAITQTVDDEDTEYAICLHNGEAPEIADAALTMLIQLVGKQYFYTDPQDFVNHLNYQNASVTVLTRYWDEMLAYEYEKIYGEPLPENFYNLLWDENGEETELMARYEVLLDKLNEVYPKYQAMYDKGVVDVQIDGSAIYYETRDAYILASNNQEVFYEDSTRPFMAFYEEKTGTPITLEELKLIRNSENYELIDAYCAMHDEMYEMYRSIAIENKASAIIVHADGSYTLSNDIESVSMLNVLSYLTPTQRIFYTLESAELDMVDMVVDLDTQGRIRTVSGTVGIITHDLLGFDHTLTVTFSGVADLYDISTVEVFDPDKYGVVSMYEYYQMADEQQITDVVQPTTTAPQTIVFNGVEYPLFIYDSNGSKG